ncbi:FAD-dependent monooxygenase [Hyalangium versicolor]|uniref:FAD-dependent monooxygenase n=1 Tax=Hyalangium versicolor TaxID=2861190 RepID=UPI001CCCC852|nr:FAD-dependent monooxygenase [Hyalangium versicolor]
MRIVCVGAGPAGLYFSILAKLSNRNHEVIVVERNPPGVTYGWGVVFWEDLLDDLYRSDPESARAIERAAAGWDTQEIHLRGQQVAHVGRYAFSMGRERLLDILLDRAKSLGVNVQFQRKVEDLSEFSGSSLIVACDGANSRIRQLHGNPFHTHVEQGKARYIWLGTDKVFNKFTFAFEETPAGWIWFHAYRFNDEASTCIVECPPETWEGLGFGQLGPDETLRCLEGIFKRHLEGHSLMIQKRGDGTTQWLNFKRVTNARWSHGNVVLMGDAAHTTHFSIGSGTKLAIQDAIGLARKLCAAASLPAALVEYEQERRTALTSLQSAARLSARWFENVPRHVDQHAVDFAWALLNRRGVPQRWRYLLHLASQDAAVRDMLRWGHSARGWVRSRLRPRASAAPG